MSAHCTVGTKGCTTSAKATARLPSVHSSGGGLPRDCAHSIGRRRHTRSSTAAVESNKDEGEDDEIYTPMSDTEKDQMFRDADEIKTAENEAPIPTGRLRDLLNRLNITTQQEFRIKRVPCPRREEYKAIVENFSEPNVLSQHNGPAFRATYQDAVANATWQTITTYKRRYHEELKNIIYRLLPQRKKNKFKTSGVKAVVPKMLMVHHQDVAVEMSTRLQAAQQEIQKLHDQLRDFDATIRGYQRMLAGEASDLYVSDNNT
jgi:hypothetical protein